MIVTNEFLETLLDFYLVKTRKVFSRISSPARVRAAIGCFAVKRVFSAHAITARNPGNNKKK